VLRKGASFKENTLRNKSAGRDLNIHRPLATDTDFTHGSIFRTEQGQNKELRDLYSSQSITRIIKSRRMRRAEHVARMGKRRDTYR
jgi:hypothetical protein